MAKRRGLPSRMVADLLVGISVAAFVAVVGRLGGSRAWAIPALSILLLAAGLAGYLEPSTRRVWIHPLVIVSPELALVTGAALTCRGFECGGFVGLLALAVLFMLLLVGLSFAVFYIKRWITRPIGT